MSNREQTNIKTIEIKEAEYMEKKLHRMFDRQRFEPHDKLSAIIADVDERYSHALSDDDLEQVSAAVGLRILPGAPAGTQIVVDTMPVGAMMISGSGGEPVRGGSSND